MTTGQLLILDHVVALLTAALWLGAGAVMAARRLTISLALLGAALVLTLGRIVSVVVLADRGWWFVQEKVLLGLPMLVLGGLTATVVAGPRLLAAARHPSVIVGKSQAQEGARSFPRSRGEDGLSLVSLLTAGYLALAGLVVTLLVGYPLSWSSALIAVAAVLAAALVTWRAAAPSVTEQQADSSTGISRRRFIGITGGAIAVGAGGSGVGLAFVPADATDAGGGAASSHPPDHAVPVTELRGPSTPAPGGQRRQHTITAQQARVTLASGNEVEAWAYNGEVPGRTITATQGDLIEVTLRNTDIDDGVTIHWHGYDVPNGEDGAPGATQDAVPPGGEFGYRFRADQVGTYWYHTHQVSAEGVRRGLYGSLVVTARAESPPQADAGLDLTLPIHTFGETTVLADHDQTMEESAAPGTPVRLRLINTDSLPHRLALAGTAFRVAAVDGRDLHEPAEASQACLRLPAGGRFDLTFELPDGPVTLLVDDGRGAGLQLSPGETSDGETSDGETSDGETSDGGPGEDTAGWPALDLLAYGTPARVPFDADSRFDRDFTLVLDRGVAMVDGSPAYAQTVNGRGHPSIPDLVVTEGDLVRFTVVNRSLETHPWHLHGHAVLVLARDEQAPSGSPLWVDTFDVRPGEVWQVGFQATNPGVWMNHCHNLPHADEGMMLQLRYDNVTTPFHSASASGHEHDH